MSARRRSRLKRFWVGVVLSLFFASSSSEWHHSTSNHHQQHVRYITSSSCYPRRSGRRRTRRYHGKFATLTLLQVNPSCRSAPPPNTFLQRVCLTTSSTTSTRCNQVSASVKETSVNGLEGLNINVAAPFKFQDYVVGFKYALGNIKRAPESLFAKRSFDTSEGQFTVDSDYTIADNTLR